MEVKDFVPRVTCSGADEETVIGTKEVVQITTTGFNISLSIL